MVALNLPAKIKNIDKLLAHCQRRHFTAKSNIICAGDEAHTLWYIVKGSVTILIEDDEGHEMIIAYLNSGTSLVNLGSLNPRAKNSNAVPGYAPKANVKLPKSPMRNFVSWPARTRTFSTPSAARWHNACVTRLAR